MKIEILKNKKSFKKGGFHTNPDIAWEIILYFAFILIVASFIFGFHLFVKINKEFTPSVPEGSSQTKIIKKERIDKVLEYFLLREQKSMEILTYPSPLIDPSQ